MPQRCTRVFRRRRDAPNGRTAPSCGHGSRNGSGRGCAQLRVRKRFSQQRLGHFRSFSDVRMRATPCFFSASLGGIVDRGCRGASGGVRFGELR